MIDFDFSESILCFIKKKQNSEVVKKVIFGEATLIFRFSF